ncbi:RloB family protein [Shewanella saliphila]|uniref:RloB domain-containing protein n=1 Tax=Shewanella saliphila TaxID=2282698 RepID=A0ABQ2Q4W7_9GAMM|nr:RloB family protein [Shewanella saliphila]MCL1099881.1 RloB family protein [Shewanella saliphila]GGP44547.1 hypothetical protein GCM10009409_09070 [Shewanella saliphila]
MGSDDLHHKRKRRGAANLSRKLGNRKPYAKILIVCEGSKTEPLYFKELIRHHKLASANVVVDQNVETCPLKLFRHAKKIAKEHIKIGMPFDQVYCVFDKDSHVHYEEAKRSIASMANKTTVYKAITSVPSFEYWLLLHFKNTTKPFDRAGKKSPADVVLSELKSEYIGYSKAKKNVYSELIDKLDEAIKNAELSRKSALELGTDNPSTEVDGLVIALRELNN